MHHVYDFAKEIDIQQFNQELDMLSYSQRFCIGGIDMADAYKNYYGTNNQIYYMAVDLKLNLFHLFTTLRELNQSQSRFDLISQIGFHRNWVNFVTLYRSFYDKYMNLVIRTAFPDEFESFDSATRKNKKFKSILIKQPLALIPNQMVVSFPVDFTNWTYDFINFINDQYRTPEVHGHGAARKWVFQTKQLSETPFNKLQELISHMEQFLNIVGCIVSGVRYAEELKNRYDMGGVHSASA